MSGYMQHIGCNAFTMTMQRDILYFAKCIFIPNCIVSDSFWWFLKETAIFKAVLCSRAPQSELNQKVSIKLPIQDQSTNMTYAVRWPRRPSKKSKLNCSCGLRDNRLGIGGNRLKSQFELLCFIISKLFYFFQGWFHRFSISPKSETIWFFNFLA